MSWRAKVYDTDNGECLAVLTVKASDLRSAESAAISKAAFDTKGDPSRMTVRQLHQRGGHGDEQ